MADKYVILGIIRVDRGMIPNGTSRNGEAVLGRHIPYYVGMIIKNLSSGVLEFLDIYNSEIFLSDYFGYNNVPLGYNMSLREMVEEQRGNIAVITIPSLENYLRTHRIRHAARNSSRMHSLAKRIVLEKCVR